MKKDIKVVVVQAKVPKDYKEGEKQVLRLVREAISKPVDMVGLPEYCVSSLTDVKNGYNAFDFFSKVAKENKIYLFGANLVREENGKIYNTGFLFDRKGKLVVKQYKLVLTPPEKDLGITSGKTLEVFDTEFGKMGILVCKDSFHRYAAWFFDALMKNGVDVVLVPSSSIFVSERSIRLWTDTLKSLSMLFNTYVVAPGTIGKKPNGAQAFGHALILCPKRVVLAEGLQDKEEILRATLDVESINWVKSTVGLKWQPKEVPKIRVVISS